MQKANSELKAKLEENDKALAAIRAASIQD
jgi:hypothetical protein